MNSDPASSALRSLSLVTAMTVGLYLYGLLYWSRFYEICGLDFSLVEWPWYRVMIPRLDVAAVFYQSLLAYTSLAPLFADLTRAHVAEWKAAARWKRSVAGIVSALSGVAFCYNLWRGQTPLASWIGMGAGLTLHVARVVPAADVRLLLRVVVALAWAAFVYVRADVDCSSRFLPPVQVQFHSSRVPLDGHLVTSDTSRYFIRDLQSKKIVVVERVNVAQLLFR